MCAYRHGQSLIGLVFKLYLLLKPLSLGEGKGKRPLELKREILKHFVLLVKLKACPANCFIALNLTKLKLMRALMHKAVNKVIKQSFVYRHIICRIGGLYYTSVKAVWQIKGRKTPYLARLVYSIGRYLVLIAEDLDLILLIIKPKHRAAHCIGDNSAIAACLKTCSLYAHK